MPAFEWDDRKAEVNRRKHGVGFNDAAQALMGLTFTQPSDGHGETRFTSVCQCGDRMIAVVWTPRDGAIRLISARSARTNERRQYREAIGGPANAR